MKDPIDTNIAKIRERRIYLLERVKVLKGELAALRTEEAELIAKLRSQPDKRAPELTPFKRRRHYIRIRRVEAKQELDAAIAAKKTLVPATV